MMWCRPISRPASISRPGGTAQWNRALYRVTRSPSASGLTCSRKVEKRPITPRSSSSVRDPRGSRPGSGRPRPRAAPRCRAGSRPASNSRLSASSTRHSPRAQRRRRRCRCIGPAPPTAAGLHPRRRMWPTPSTNRRFAGIMRRPRRRPARRAGAVLLQRVALRHLQRRPEAVAPNPACRRRWSAGRRGRRTGRRLNM